MKFKTKLLIISCFIIGPVVVFSFQPVNLFNIFMSLVISACCVGLVGILMLKDKYFPSQPRSYRENNYREQPHTINININTGSKRPTKPQVYGKDLIKNQLSGFPFKKRKPRKDDWIQ